MKLSRMSIDWPGFLTNANVKAMPPLTRGVYLLLLGAMWTNDGWLRNDDRIIARMLDMDVRTWRSHRPFIEPELTVRSDPFLGSILQQERLSREYQHTLELVEKKRAQTEPARRKRHANTRPGPSATEPKPRPATSPATAPATGTATRGEAEAEKKERALPLQAESPLHAEPFTVTALPPRPSLGLEGRSVADDAEPNDALRKRLVADGLKRPSLSDIANLGRRK